MQVPARLRLSQAPRAELAARSRSSLARQGACVLVNYHASAAAAQAVVGEIVAAGQRLCARRRYRRRGGGNGHWLGACLERWGRLDLLVNNAGVTADAPDAAHGYQQWRRVIDTDLTGVFLCCRAALGPMRARRYGRIVNVGSLAGLAGNVGQANYAAAKAGLVGMTRALAREVALDGITANVVAPGVSIADRAARQRAHRAAPVGHQCNRAAPVRPARGGGPSGGISAVAAGLVHHRACASD